MSAEQRKQLDAVLRWLRIGVMEVHHGGAVGADTQFDDAVRSIYKGQKIGFITVHPANGQPLARNRAIVAASDILIAAPESDTEQRRSGTWATVRYARAKGIPVIMLSRGTR